MPPAKLPLLAAAVLLIAAPPALAAKHGDLISKQPISGRPALPAAKTNLLVSYRTKGVDGQLVPVTGVVSIPKGKAPKGGWPVFTWAHGTTGIADICAPSLQTPDSSSPYDLSGTNTYVEPFLTRLLKAGFVVVKTDYEGLGTPGEHPYLNGVSEGRSVLDIVRAARKVSRSVGRRFVIAGHSQGGHAALWAAALAPKWTPELKLGGTVAFAPASHLGEQFSLFRAFDITSLSGLAGLILRGAAIARPDLNVESLLSDKARALWPETLTKCVSQLSAADSWGGLKASEIAAPDADLNALLAYINSTDPEDLKIRGRVLVLQGKADTTVMPSFTASTVQDLRRRGAKVTYRTYTGVTHTTVATESKPLGAAYTFAVGAR